ncbi:DNA (cytosine-5-)-methyltransferase [uncultured Prevotella sp.]|uniref:DNA cytosine methyltransferase n=1 Tax=uncultured Prevotella sp. TaxID=159272 RepID=UPI00262A862A|nr:DNA (cytosine-5-)-methyltransferase [uncultured Prevotella sp.]
MLKDKFESLHHDSNDDGQGELYPYEKSDFLSDIQLSINFHIAPTAENDKKHRILSLFSGCGGMDLGFEGGFIANAKSFSTDSPFVERVVRNGWVMLKRTDFTTVFANDILPEAETAWTTYMSRFGHTPEMYHRVSIVDLVKMHNNGVDVFPRDIDVVTGGFPCQDFSVAGKRKGFDSDKNDMGVKRNENAPSEETRGKLYYWMKQVIDIVRPKVFVAENVKGLVNLGDVKDIIQRDFASADGNGYIVLPPQVLNAGNYGVPESRERVIFIGIRKDVLRKQALAALTSESIPEEYNPYPRPTHAGNTSQPGLLPKVTTYDVLKYLPEPADAVDPSQRIYSKAKFQTNGSQGQTEIKLDGLGPTIRSEHHGNIEYRRLSAEHGGKHIAELNNGMQERRLTPRECALIQTFPPDFRFVMHAKDGRKYRLSSSGAYKVIGNAVPPVLAFNIAMRLQNLWDKYFID